MIESDQPGLYVSTDSYHKKSATLLPCPHCGSVSVKVNSGFALSYGISGWASVNCMQCAATGPKHVIDNSRSKYDAIRADIERRASESWNKRLPILRIADGKSLNATQVGENPLYAMALDHLRDVIGELAERTAGDCDHHAIDASQWWRAIKRARQWLQLYDAQSVPDGNENHLAAPGKQKKP